MARVCVWDLSNHVRLEENKIVKQVLLQNNSLHKVWHRGMRTKWLAYETKALQWHTTPRVRQTDKRFLTLINSSDNEELKLKRSGGIIVAFS